MNVKLLHKKYPLFLSDFNEPSVFSTDFSEEKKLTCQISSKSVEWEASCSMRADVGTDVKLTATFRNPANAPISDLFT
jgi:hypothetical protein